MKKLSDIRFRTPLLVLPLVIGLSACGGGSSYESNTVSSSVSSISSSSSVESSSSESSSSSSQGIPHVLVSINAGGDAVTLDGIDYQADTYAIGGTANSTEDAITGATDGTLYQTERYGSFTYNLPVTDASYSLTLHFAEIYNTEAGARSFNVLVEGVEQMSAVDLYTLAGHDGAYSYEINDIDVNDGHLTIQLESLVDNATIAGFSVVTSNGELETENRVFPDFFVGNITTDSAVRSDFMTYWDQITPENEGKWRTVEYTRDVYNWGGIDRAYNFAKQNGIPFKQHTFVWGQQFPDWIDKISPTEQAEEIEEWIRDYCARYPDTEMIDVVNEASPDHAPAEFAKTAFGDDWVTKSFQLARKYCRNSILILNDYNLLSWHADRFIEMARPAVNAGVVDAIGLQAHGLADLSLDRIKENMAKLETLGLPIYITEYDIEKTDDQEQLAVMQEQFDYFYNHPSIKGITLWGYVDGFTWLNGTGLIYPDGTHRPAMDWLMEYLGRD